MNQNIHIIVATLDRLIWKIVWEFGIKEIQNHVNGILKLNPISIIFDFWRSWNYMYSMEMKIWCAAFVNTIMIITMFSMKLTVIAAYMKTFVVCHDTAKRKHFHSLLVRDVRFSFSGYHFTDSEVFMFGKHWQRPYKYTHTYAHIHFLCGLYCAATFLFFFCSTTICSNYNLLKCQKNYINGEKKWVCAPVR